jgi:hypothetical protein
VVFQGFHKALYSAVCKPLVIFRVGLCVECKKKRLLIYLLESEILCLDCAIEQISKLTILVVALVEYFKAKKVALRISQSDDLKKIEDRINDMKLRMKSEDFVSVEKKYDK